MHQKKPTDGGAQSYLSSRPDFRSSKLNPIEDAADSMQRLGLKIDWIVCPGDISDKNDVVSAGVAWGYMDNLRRRLHARRLIGAVGNHDVDSRREDERQLPDDALRTLAPPFPVSDQQRCAQYWANHYLIWRDNRADATLVLLNTCVLHGVAVPAGADPEHQRGYLTDGVLNRLAAEIPRKLSRFNMLVMHHHIRQHPWLSGENSHAVNGPRLLELLKRTSVRWVVIHGHQHLPNLSYWDDTPSAPVILSAGSVAAKTYPVNGKTPRHLIDFDCGAAAANPPLIRGQIFSWNWATALGWTEASRDSGLPRECGFGERGGLAHLVASVRDALNGAPARRLTQSELATQVNGVQFLIPDDLEELVHSLEQSGVRVLYDRYQCPVLFELSH
jgi:3',5'-cyclic AMP phosphodiesterase CpdA